MFNKVGIYIGRFQPFHKGHASALDQVVYACDKIIVLIGSSYTSVSPKNPFTGKERLHMISEYINMNYADAGKDIVVFPIKDYSRDIDWEKAVQEVVKNCTTEKDEINLFGHFKDDSSRYLKSFPQWDFVNIRVDYPVNATDIREKLFESGTRELNVLPPDQLHLMPPSTVSMVNMWRFSPRFESMKTEYLFYKDYKKKFEGLEYEPTFVTVDAVILDHTGKVLLNKRKNFPGKGYWAMPGGFVKPNETLEQSIIQIVKEKCGITLDSSMIRATRVVDTPGRSLRGRTITHVFVFKLPKGYETPGSLNWFNVNQLFLYEEEMFEDHQLIIEGLV